MRVWCWGTGRRPTIPIRERFTPHSVLFAVNHSIVTIAVILTSLSPVAWIAMLPVAETFASLKSFFVRIVVYMVSLVTLLTFAQIDPGGFVGWFLD